MYKYFLVLLLSYFLFGCAKQTNRFGPDKIRDVETNSEEGMIIISTGAKEDCSYMATFLRILDSEDKEIGTLSVDASVLKSDYSGHHGNLHALKLKKGDYYLIPWIANPYVSLVEPHRLDFTVISSKTIYLGEYYMPTSCGSGTAVIGDEYERDIELLITKNSKFSSIKIDKKILEFK